MLDRTSASRATQNPYATVLRAVLPGGPAVHLLRACLCQRETAAQAWADFTREVGDAKAFFEKNQTGLKGLLPFIEQRLTANEIDADGAFLTYARVAAVREGLRLEIYLKALASMLDALATAGIDTVVLKGAAVSATVYPRPPTRHNHAIDLWVRDESLDGAIEALKRARCTEVPIIAGHARHRLLRHHTSLAVGLHSRPLFLPHFEMPVEELRERTRDVAIGGARARVLASEDAFVHLCGHATYSRTKTNLRWVCDAHYLVSANPAFDWARVIHVATAARLALPLAEQLRWLKRELGTPVPEMPLAALARVPIDGRTKEGVLAAVFHGGAPWRESLRRARVTSRTTIAFLRFSVLPSAFYMRWKYGEPPAWKLPYYYVQRAARFFMAHIWRPRATAGPVETNARERS